MHELAAKETYEALDAIMTWVADHGRDLVGEDLLTDAVQRVVDLYRTTPDLAARTVGRWAREQGEGVREAESLALLGSGAEAITEGGRH